MPADPAQLALLLAAASAAGTPNAVAGGGSFLTLPALVYTGMPAVAANATGTVALLPGYESEALGFREDIEPPPGLTLRTLALLNAMNGLKNPVSALLTAIAVAIYAWGGVVGWAQALVMMVAATAGGYFGARVARRIPPVWLRGGIVVTWLVMAALFF